VRPTSNLRVETPEGIVFSFPLASPLTRALAYSIDLAAIAAGAGILAKGVRIFGILGPDWVAAFSVLASFVISLAYGIFLEWHWRGQTLGKRVLRLRVIDARGLRLEFTQVVVRNLLRAVDMLPILYLTGAVAAFVTNKGQRVGDLAAGTIVVHEPNIVPPDLEHIAPAKYNSLLAYPHLAARLRNRVSPEAASLIMKALLLRDTYDSSARIMLFRKLADHYRSLVPFPEEVVEGLTDEQYLRGVVCALYATDTRPIIPVGSIARR
jgi:uncharacterized RDD family membrane protein YckC